jgi:CRP/FNR family transcriptional regulator/CRP/FNR family cyclic AMP-dependent transcriptional regulator
MANYNNEKSSDFFLFKLPLFTELDNRDLESIRKFITVRNYKKGMRIKNELGKYLFIVYKGKIKEFQKLNCKKEVIHSVLRKGDTFGELFIFGNSSYNREYIVMEDTKLLLIEAKKLYELIRKCPAFSKNIVKDMINNLYKSYFQIEFLTLYNAKEKVPIALILLNERTRIGNKIKVENSITFKDVSFMTGNSREVISRIIKYHYQTGEITKENNSLIFNNQKFLSNILSVNSIENNTY